MGQWADIVIFHIISGSGIMTEIRALAAAKIVEEHSDFVIGASRSTWLHGPSTHLTQLLARRHQVFIWLNVVMHRANNVICERGSDMIIVGCGIKADHHVDAARE
ncbi:uridine 5'-monophosphate synthase-like [Bidens hawaiensis]|uniref:uridine 5'-monophosphate synthase-like n=1 Tax=Bidens hawaiensis TaxID=980011 RepID=UPI00404A81A4